MNQVAVDDQVEHVNWTWTRLFSFLFFTAAYDNSNTDIDTNAIQQGAGLLDVRSSSDEQSSASSNLQQTGQYTASSNGNYDTGAYQAQSQTQYAQQAQPQYSQYSQQAQQPQYAASASNYAGSSQANYLPPTHQH